jgi:hypothetical protein
VKQYDRQSGTGITTPAKALARLRFSGSILRWAMTSKKPAAFRIEGSAAIASLHILFIIPDQGENDKLIGMDGAVNDRVSKAPGK